MTQAAGKAKGRKTLERVAWSLSAARQILLRPKNGFRETESNENGVIYYTYRWAFEDPWGSRHSKTR